MSIKPGMLLMLEFRVRETPKTLNSVLLTMHIGRWVDDSGHSYWAKVE